MRCTRKRQGPISNMFVVAVGTAAVIGTAIAVVVVVVVFRVIV